MKALKCPVQLPPKSDADMKYLALVNAWSRAGMAARRMFVDEMFDDLSPLVVDAAEARDEADIATLRAGLPEAAE